MTEDIAFYKPSIDENEIELIKEALKDNGSVMIERFEAELKTRR